MADDYYALLELNRNASAEEIRTAIREQRRVWIRRQSSPDPDRRTHAEQRVRDLDAAEKMLLDTGARADYDRQLGRRSATPSGSEGNRTRDGGGDPTPRRIPYSSGSTRNRSTDPATPGGWLARAVDAASRQDHEAAIEAYAQVLRLTADNSETLDAHRGLAQSYLATEKYRQAAIEYESVLATEPEDSKARTGLAECYLHTERVEDGLATLKVLVNAEPDNQEIRRTYAYALYQQAWDGLAEVSDGRLAMSRRQVRLLQRNERRIGALGIDDSQVEGWRSQLERLRQDATRRRKVPSHRKRYYLGAWVVACVLALAGPSQVSQVLGALLLVFITWTYFQRHRPPMWHVRRKQLRRETLQRGI